MIELPEGRVLADQIGKAYQGMMVQTVVANASPHGFAWYRGNPDEYDDLLCGKRVEGTAAYGGHVEIRLEDMLLQFNDGLNLRYLAEEEAPPKKHQLYITFEEGPALVGTVQMYAGIIAIPAAEADNPYLHVAKEKPSPLTPAFDRAYFQSLFENVKKNLSVKAFLATEQRIPGLGNGVLQDILFNARLHPKTKLSSIDQGDLDRLYQSIKDTLLSMTAQGGRDTEKDLYGVYGGYQSILSKRTLPEPCKTCGDTLIRQAYLGGNVYFCPTCQPLKGQ